jgi:CRP/FNR family transcriptional regulator, cyclic AMP receptor protein
MASRAQIPAIDNPKDRSTVLWRHPFFTDLPIDIQKRLVNYVKLKHYDAGSLIFSKGDPGDSLFFVYTGIVKIDTRSYEGKDAVFNLVTEGQFFGEIALLDGLPRTANASAFTNCELMIFLKRDLSLIIERHPPLMLRIVQLLCARLRQTMEQVENLMFIDLAGRLAKTLLELSSVSKTPGRICITQREIAQLAGLSREMTNKQLRTWARVSFIKMARNEISVLKPAELYKLASPTELE